MGNLIYLPPLPVPRSSAPSKRSNKDNEATDRKVIIHRNTPRLTHYLEESNTGPGFIKEVSFSPDGRILCSPFGFGVR